MSEILEELVEKITSPPPLVAAYHYYYHCYQQHQCMSPHRVLDD